MVTKLPRNALAAALIRAFRAATESPDIGAMVSMEAIIAHEGAYGLPGLEGLVARDPIDFLMVAAPGFDKQLKATTGRSRDEKLSFTI